MVCVGENVHTASKYYNRLWHENKIYISMMIQQFIIYKFLGHIIIVLYAILSDFNSE